MRSVFRRTWQRAAQAYHLACARDDAAKRKITVPDGVWVCDHCDQGLLELTALREHIRTQHAYI
jgi:hypothetical protein